MTQHETELAELGWRPFFSSQLETDELDATTPVRVMAVHRDALQVVGERIDETVPPLRTAENDEESAATVGDWLLIEATTHRPLRRLERFSVFKRRAAGTGRRIQLIAANVDTLFVVSSCNQDYNPARIERYLALANEADAMPVVVLTKADLSDDAHALAAEVARLSPGLLVETVDAREPGDVARLASWCGRGQTVALVGSSGVGKSTLVNTMTGAAIATQGIREDDAKGRHTTTARALHRLPAGGWLLDTPGMRELQLTDVRDGIDSVFDDVTALAASCRFADCRHDSEPGCAVRSAIEAGDLDPDRLARWRKLVAEESYNREALHERRSREKAFGKMVKEVVREKRRRR